MRRIICCLVVFILSISVTSCNMVGLNNNNNQPTPIVGVDSENNILDKGPVKGGVLNLFSTTPDTLNPLLTKNIFVKDFSSLIFEGLFSLDSDQKPIPVLAKDFQILNNGLTWNISLKDNVRWQNGTPFTGNDVKFTIDTIKKSSVDSIYKDNVQNISMCYVIDKNTIRIDLKTPNSFTAELLTFPIISKKYYSGKDLLKLNSKKNMKPIGTGPYKYVSGARSKRIVLKANNDWWDSTDPNTNSNIKMPYISKVLVKVYKNSTDADNAFLSGAIDVAYIEPNGFDRYVGRTDFKIRKYTSNSYDFISFNLSNSILKDKYVRQAISYAIDRNKVIDDAVTGGGVISDIPIIPGTWLFNNYYSHSTKKALDILKKAGYKNENGTLYKLVYGYRIPLRFELTVNNNNSIRCKIAESICSQLRNIGFEASVKKVSWDVLKSNVTSNRFDAVLAGYDISSIPDISFAYSSYEISSGLNISRYRNKSVDSYLDKINSQLNAKDSEGKKVLYFKMDDIIFNEVPSIGICFYNNAIVYNKRVSGELQPLAWNRLYDITKWYIPEG